MCQVSLWFDFYISEKAEFSAARVHRHWLEMEYCRKTPRKGGKPDKNPTFKICFTLNPLENRDVCKMFGGSPFSAVINQKFLELMVFQVSIFVSDFYPARRAVTRLSQFYTPRLRVGC